MIDSAITAKDLDDFQKLSAGAIISPDNHFRYMLWRFLRPPGVCDPDKLSNKTVSFLMLNPSDIIIGCD